MKDVFHLTISNFAQSFARFVLDGFLCLKFILHVKLATVYEKKAKVKRKQHEKATVCLNMLRITHLT